MKKIYTLATILVASITFAQKHISFETSEGYTLGNINGQNGWEATRNKNNQPIKNQSISNQQSTDGTNSLKIDVDTTEDLGWFATFGATKTLSQAQDFKNVKVEFDVRLTKKEGSSFDFGSWSTKDGKLVPVFFFAFNATGIIEVVDENFYQYTDTGTKWDTNQWYKLRAEINETEIEYFVDNTLIYTGANYSKSKILGFKFLHDNFDGAAFIDNIKINGEDLATYEATASKTLKVYPNPAKDFVTITSEEKITTYSIYNTAGQKVKSGTSAQNIDIKSLSTGAYILQATTENGKTLSTKIVKK